MATLREIADDVLFILDALDKAEENGFDPKPLEEQLSIMYGQLTEKVDGYVRMVRQADAQIDLLKEELNAIKKRIKNLERIKESMLYWAKTVMQVNGWDKLSGTTHDIVLRNTPGRVEVVNEDVIPPEYIDVQAVSRVNKKAILEALREGKNIPGVKLTKEVELRLK